MRCGESSALDGITIMEWPACSLDLKQRIERDVQDNATLAQMEQITILIQQWQAISMHRIHTLIYSMTTRVR